MELILLIATPAALPLIAAGLQRYGLARVQSALGRDRRHAAAADVARQCAEAGRLAWIVKVGAMYGLWPANCLQRSVLLWWYLRQRGIDGQVCIGVRRDRATNELDFHAWVEHGGMVLNDRSDVRDQYATFDRAVAPRTASFR